MFAEQGGDPLAAFGIRGGGAVWKKLYHHGPDVQHRRAVGLPRGWPMGVRVKVIEAPLLR